jgi:mono/diheme cytochrome c family protein
VALPPVDAATTRQQQTVDGLQIALDTPSELPTFRPQELVVSLRDMRGQPVAGAVVSLDLAMPMLCASGGTPQATETSPGSYLAETSYEMSGAWNVTITVEQVGSRRTAIFLVNVQEDQTTALINPFAADVAAIDAGRQIYAGNCASCHGDSGRGDGPAAAGLQPLPADLTSHLAPGKHSDGEIFRWLRDGVPGSAMPAFGAVISEENRWRLISYLRTLPDASSVELAGPLPPLVFMQAGNLVRGDGVSVVPQPVPGATALGSFRGPVFAPDGQRLAVVASRSTPVTETGRFSVPTLYLLRPDGSETQPLWDAPDQELAEPAWTADGSAVVVVARSFTATGDGGGFIGEPELLRVDVATGARTTLLANAQSPAFSPDGKGLAYVQEDDAGTSTLMLAASDGSNPQPLVADPSFQTIEAPRFAPDGGLIVFSAAGGPQVDADGRPVAAAEPTLVERALALLAPATAEAHGGNWEVWSIKPDGSDLRRLTRLATHDPVAAFSPDGTQIAVASEEGIHLMNRDGSTPRRLYEVMALGGVTWAPTPQPTP